MSDDPLAAMFSPRTVAVIGASRDASAIGYQILRNILSSGYTGAVYPVNPKARAVLGVRCHASVEEIPDEVDMAVVVVPARVVLDVVDACGRKGVRGLVVITAGFRETGPAGAALERELARRAKGHGMRMVGPNCMGIINAHPDVSLNATFAPAAVAHGGTAIMSQSGALGIAILAHAAALGLGVSRFVSMGNKADVSGNDLLELWEDDPDVKTILMYLEGFGNPRNFVRIARRVARKKPILAVKSGRTAGGARAASSHTGALAELDVATDALLEQCGVVRAGRLEELFDYALAVANQPLPAGARVAIITNSGGPGIMAADAMAGTGLELAEFSPAVRDRIRGALAAEASASNPVDLLAAGGPQTYAEVLDAALGDPAVDAVVAIYTAPMVTDDHAVAQAVVDAGRRHADKPLLAVFLGRGSDEPAFATLSGAGIPVYAFPESAIRSLWAMRRVAYYREREDGTVPTLRVDRRAVERIVEHARSAGREWLTQEEALGVLSAYGLNVAASRSAQDEAAAVAAAQEIGYPVVLKAEAPGLVHKSDVGAVRLDLKDAAAVRQGYADLASRMETAGFTMEGVLVMKQAPRGSEVLLGLTQDPKFGPLVAFGLGGIYAEVLKDVVFHLAPLTDEDARRMIRAIKAHPLLEGVRGQPPADTEALADALTRLARLGFDFPQILEMDANPVFVHPKGEGVTVADARLRVDLATTAGHAKPVQTRASPARPSK